MDIRKPEDRSRAAFVAEVETWLRTYGFDLALTRFANFLASRIEAGETDGGIKDMQTAWEEAVDNWTEEEDDFEPPSYEDQQAERDRREYEAGKAEGEMRRAERKIYGDKLADAFHAQDDLNRYNRGEDD